MEDIVYALVDPRTGETRYVGLSHCGLKRPRHHRMPSSIKRTSHKNNWIKLLHAAGLTYEIAVLHQQPMPDGLSEAEVFWIAEMRSRGHRLTNVSVGGQDGRLGTPTSKETRKKLSIAHLGKPKSESHKASMRKPKSKSAVANMRIAKYQTPVDQICLETGLVIATFSGINATKDVGFAFQNVWKCLKGYRHHADGFGWATTSESSG